LTNKVKFDKVKLLSFMEGLDSKMRKVQLVTGLLFFSK